MGNYMPRKTSTVTIYLRQLSKVELLKLAKKKKVRIPESWTKGKIVENLSTIVSTRDVTKLLSKKAKAKTKTELGLKSALKGIRLEDRVMRIYTRKGFECNKNIRMKGTEIDVVGFKKGGFLSNDECVIIECKNKAKVIPADFKKFVGSMNLYIRKKRLDPELVRGYLYTTGIFDKDVRSQARAFPKIQLKRLKPK